MNDAVKLNDKGQCPACLRKPLTYKRDRFYSCIKCHRHFDLCTGMQIESWAWIPGPTGWLRTIKMFPHTMDCDGIVRAA